jgi:hypothetical protein
MPQLEAVLDPRCHSLDPLELQAAYIKLLKRAAGNEEYLRGRAIEGHTFNNQGGCALGLVREMLTDSEERKKVFSQALAQQRQVMSQVHGKHENQELALQENELLLEFIHRSNAPLETRLKMRKMRDTNNEVLTVLTVLTVSALPPLPFSQVNGYILLVDGMRIDPRCHASR